MNNKRPLTSILALCCAFTALTSACDSHDDAHTDHDGHGDSHTAGTGTITLTIYGEDFIERGIPAEDFSDGWAVTFDKFLISISGVALNPDNAAAVPVPGAFVFDLSRPSDPTANGHPLQTLQAPSGHYAHLTYAISPATSASTAANASTDDLTLMTSQSLSLHVAGSATKGDTTKTFAWSFTTDTTFQKCALTKPHLDPNSTTSAMLTIHGDHFFYDDLESDTPNLAFDLLASADADADNVITLTELAAVDITGQTRYQVGSRPITDLRAYVEALTTNLGHIDGEGHCDTP